MEGRGEDELEAQTRSSLDKGTMGGGTSGSVGGSAASSNGTLPTKTPKKRIRDFVGRLTGTSGDKKGEDAEDDDSATVTAADGSKVDAIEPKSERAPRRVLYTANVGDARAVLW